MVRRPGLCAFGVVCALAIVLVGLAMTPGSMAQVNTSTLIGRVTDPQGLPVRGAKITVTNRVTSAERSVEADDDGRYNIIGLAPGQYRVTVDGGANFATFEKGDVAVTVGEVVALYPKLELRGLSQSVMVTTDTAPVETTKSEVSQVVNQRRIDNLPINGRSYINFTLTNSQTTRDVSPTIGPAPTSGLNVGGQRARSNEVSVDGADAVDNSINGIRATVSQEAVQEFQLILGDYSAEYGRATGGVINIVTKSGGNDVHGDVFGYLRNKSFQARNAFSGQVDPTTGELDPTKQAFTRVQAGATIGGALKKDKTFYFFSYEDTLREETGFSSIGEAQGGGGPWGLVPLTLPTPSGPVPVQLTAGQASTVQSLLTSGVPADQNLAVQYGLLLGSASSVALNKLDFGTVSAGLSGATLSPGPGAQFPVPV
ncbi:MAG: carboxypeptidase regulatory-like domain-containing protein, partial [Acidobacteria bacterium]|nr:carboxypeptidase regulatory-like domain-containing protein [Acidobacteriota bacterium]